MDCKQQQKLLLELEVQEPFQCIKDESSLKTLDRYTIFSTIGHQSHLLETTIYIYDLLVLLRVKMQRHINQKRVNG
jgi:hypothetical protein